MASSTKTRAGQEISPFHVGARLRIAEENIKEQKFEEALPLAAEVIKLKLKNGLANMILGERLLGKGDVARGVAELEMARKQAPESARTRWDLLRAYSSAGRGANANHEKEDIEKLNRLEFRHEL